MVGSNGTVDGKGETSRKPVELVRGALDGGVLFLCDHASNAIPDEYCSLGLPPAELERHIAYDIGAADATKRLAALFGAPAVLTAYSRLLIDANRGADDPTLVMRISDDAVIPGNAYVQAEEIERRRALYWKPYRETVAGLLDAMIGTGSIPAIVSLHSFTPIWKGQARPWQIAVLWDSDPRLPIPLIAALRELGLLVGDNEPYDGALAGDTLDAHANARGLANLLIEFRQDLVADSAAAEFWANRLAGPLRTVLADAKAHMIERYPSRARARFPSGPRKQ